MPGCPGNLVTTDKMADKQQEKRPLKTLLEKVYEVHRNDIKDYASGHLNLSKLMKGQNERHAPWQSSKEPPIRYELRLAVA